MPQRQAITQERLDRLAKNVVEAAMHNVLRKTNARCSADLTCTLFAEESEQITCKTMVKFKWGLSYREVFLHAEMPIRADKAMYDNLLSPPKPWSCMLLAIAIPHAIGELGGLPWMKEGDALECKGLAMATPTEAPPESCVILEKGRRREHLVLARLQEGQLLCVSNLLHKPTKYDATQVWAEDTSRKRLYGRIEKADLVNKAKKHSKRKIRISATPPTR